MAPSVRARLWFLMAVVAVPASLLSGWLIFESYRNERRAMERHLMESVQAFSLLLDAELRERMAVAQSLAMSTALREGDFEGFRWRAQRLVTRNQEWVILADAEGKVLVDTGPLPGPERLFFDTNPMLLGELAEGRPYVSNLIVSEKGPRHSVWVAVSARVGETQPAVLCIALTPGALVTSLLRSSREQHGTVAVLDRDGTVVARSRNAETFVGRSPTPRLQRALKDSAKGVTDTIAVDGHPSIAAFCQSPETGWWVAMAGHKAELIKPAKRMLGVALTVTALAGIVGLGLGFWASSVTEAVARQVMAATQALARGERVKAQRTGIVEADIALRALAETSAELATRQAALEQARDTAVAASRAKDEFLASLSHELRTPLNPVLLLASDAARDEALPPPVRMIFAMIEKNVIHEARLIDDLLDVTRIVSGKLALRLRPMILDTAVKDALETLRPRALEKQLNVHEELAAAGACVLGDSTRLQQVFANVIGNAMKFTPEGGKVAVKSRVDPEQRELVVEVSDSGVGMSAGEISRIFERFVQGDHADGRQSKYGGLGLGLSISRSLVELHSGTIEATSAGAGRGSTFKVRLPLQVG